MSNHASIRKWGPGPLDPDLGAKKVTRPHYIEGCPATFVF